MKRILLTASVLLITTVANADSGNVALWHLDEDIGATTVSDSSGNGHTGIIFGDPIVGSPGKFGNAIEFDGDDYIEFEPSNSILDSDTFTIETWFSTTVNHPPYGSGEGRLINLHRTDTASTAVSLYLEQGKIGLLYYTGGSPAHVWVKHDTNYYDGEWHHIAVTYDGSTYKLYFDGIKEEESLDEHGGFGTFPAYLAVYNSSERFFEGQLDEVRIYDYAQPEVVIQSHANGIYYDSVIDIKPGSDPNSINLDSNGVIPVAILTTSVAAGDLVDFDAADCDPATIKLEGGSVRVRGKGALAHMEDVDGDGDFDLVVKIENEMDLAIGATTATLTGKTWGGLGFKGMDSIFIVPPQ